MADENALRDCIRLCERLSNMIEDDAIELSRCLEGDVMRSYRELTELERELLSDCKRLIDRGR